MVVAHLRHCARTGAHLNEQVYRALGDAKDSQLVLRLRGEPCVQVSSRRVRRTRFRVLD